jgi:hypothetical protein
VKTSTEISAEILQATQSASTWAIQVGTGMMALMMFAALVAFIINIKRD